jgi:hypothetical protein
MTFLLRSFACLCSNTLDESFPAVLARLTARDGLAFAKICTFYDLRKSLIAEELNDNTIDKLCFLRSYFKHDPNLKI